MTAHLSDSDRQALRLAHELREEMRLALPQQVAAPSVSPYVDPSGRPSVLLRMDEETARAVMALLVARRMDAGQAGPQTRRADGTHVPPGAADPAFAVPGPRQGPPPHPGFPPGQGGAPEYPAAPVGAPEFQGHEFPGQEFQAPGFHAPGFAPSHHTGPVPVLPTAYPTH